MNTSRPTRILMQLMAIVSLAFSAGVPLGHASLQASHGHCSIEIPNGSTIIDQYNVRFPDGDVHAFSQKDCSNVSVVPTISGWIEDASGYASGGFTQVFSDWYVPSGPSNTNDPVNFFFDGIQPNGLAWVAQPVLSWGCQQYTLWWCSVGGHNWYISAWVVYANNGPSYHSNLIQVNSGDHIYGDTFYTYNSANCANGGSGAHYDIIISDNTIGTGNSLNFCTSTIGQMGYSGVFEAYRVDNCNQLPNQSSETFYGIGTTPTISSWNPQIFGVSPSCGYSVSASTSQATLNWNP